MTSSHTPMTPSSAEPIGGEQVLARLAHTPRDSDVLPALGGTAQMWSDAVRGVMVGPLTDAHVAGVRRLLKVGSGFQYDNPLDKSFVQRHTGWWRQALATNRQAKTVGARRLSGQILDLVWDDMTPSWRDKAVLLALGERAEGWLLARAADVAHSSVASGHVCLGLLKRGRNQIQGALFLAVLPHMKPEWMVEMVLGWALRTQGKPHKMGVTPQQVVTVMVAALEKGEHLSSVHAVQAVALIVRLMVRGIPIMQGAERAEWMTVAQRLMVAADTAPIDTSEKTTWASAWCNTAMCGLLDIEEHGWDEVWRATCGHMEGADLARVVEDFAAGKNRQHATVLRAMDALEADKRRQVWAGLDRLCQDPLWAAARTKSALLDAEIGTERNGVTRKM